MVFTHKNKNKRPKFLFSLQINELVNIPQSSGNCYVKWNFRKGTGTTKVSAPATASSSSSSSSIRQSRGDTKSQATTQGKGITPHVQVKHHRAQWNYSIRNPIEIKLLVDKNGNVMPKILLLDVFFEFIEDTGVNSSTSSSKSLLRSSSLKSPRTSIDLIRHKKETQTISDTNIKSTGRNSYSQRVSSKLLLGSVSINVAEYIREDESPVSNRFLLRNSKVNSIINLTMQLNLIRGSYEDFNIPKVITSGQLSGAFHGGIGNIFENASFDGSSEVSHANNTPGSSVKTPRTGATNGVSTISNTMSPLIDSLYEKTFELSWDPRPGEFSPKECVEDILRGGNGWAKNENGINLIDLQALRLSELESDYYTKDVSKTKTDADNNWRRMNRKEYLEKTHQNWSHLSASQREKRRNEANMSSADEFENTVSRDIKSWSVAEGIF
ncbi:hypothetical protein KAFR_0L01890 [Kazachstania africana CBS 2517]|uniref:C2 NT-type domain-containing protein n=1 Tax=Kazachstania africana (strain ATCC 22294 / BCRC 22015 / CBS 2517 / CECT 1963 / NBRC 1671 / NRRL Y-8276) TaxID=1071382 RepID=H2B2E9_KAZAF|nr:hypothetical protein KAFR_0L01890 [Kazachstania africana CBS 2517]CCF60799.1 hypothetical protein KAFR_0L01890 [Kazachstania africana CBS 2517]